ncbi:uncharacterized protein LOC62_01G000109 [Vanrija pseudolonga]|uniref:Uncharacterized protein n=1 Tax=Vanrija pseudolonga TaxID=143232 RepID=A0AAF0XYY0_9TREE|nr:hypothetical protein LOC62_01G000109 [Vanrija pseudolonga]
MSSSSSESSSNQPPAEKFKPVYVNFPTSFKDESNFVILVSKNHPRVQSALKVDPEPSKVFENDPLTCYAIINPNFGRSLKKLHNDLKDDDKIPDEVRTWLANRRIDHNVTRAANALVGVMTILEDAEIQEPPERYKRYSSRSSNDSYEFPDL